MNVVKAGGLALKTGNNMLDDLIDDVNSSSREHTHDRSSLCPNSEYITCLTSIQDFPRSFTYIIADG